MKGWRIGRVDRLDFAADFNYHDRETSVGEDGKDGCGRGGQTDNTAFCCAYVDEVGGVQPVTTSGKVVWYCIDKGYDCREHGTGSSRCLRDYFRFDFSVALPADDEPTSEASY